MDVTQWLLDSGPWLYAGVFALVVADAFTVVLPGEIVVVALAALAISTGVPALWALIVVAWAAAVTGDNLTYLVGHRIGTQRWAWIRRPRPQAAVRYARTALEQRPASLLFTARYIPYARIAANLTAGATHFSYARFLPLTVAAGLTWALYNTVIGALFGAWLSANPVLAIVLSVVCAIVLGVTVDALVARWTRRRDRRQSPESHDDSATTQTGD